MPEIKEKTSKKEKLVAEEEIEEMERPGREQMKQEDEAAIRRK